MSRTLRAESVWIARVLTVCGVTLLSLRGGADEGRYQDYALGARALGLGGAYTAISDDPSGVFYNPAGLVDVSRARLSIFSVEGEGEVRSEGNSPPASAP